MFPRQFQTQECSTEKSLNGWHRRGTPNTGNTYHQPNRLSTDRTHKPSMRHYLKGSPGDKTHNTDQHSSWARLQHSNHPSSPTPKSVTTRSSQPTQPLQSTGGLSHTTTQNTPRLSGDKQHPPAWGSPFSGVADGQPKTHGPSLGRGRGGEGLRMGFPRRGGAACPR